jgi:hypothetical protein
MAKVFVFIYSPIRGFSIEAEFARIPTPGEHIFLWLPEDQRISFGEGYNSEPATPALVQDTILRAAEGAGQYEADIFAKVVSEADWTRKYANYGALQG